MSEENKRLNVSTENDVTIVEFTDQKILDEINIMEIGDQLNELVAEATPPRLVLDFGVVAHMSSSALGVLITMHKRVRLKEGVLALCNIQPTIYEIFVITRLNEIFDIHASREDALASLA